MKMNEYLARLLLQARDAAPGEVADKIAAGLRDLGVTSETPAAESVGILAAKLAKGGRKKALGLVTEAGIMARQDHAAACERLYALTALQRHLNDGERERTVMPWEQQLAAGCAPLAEMLRSQNAILTEPLKQKKKDDGEGDLDVELPSGVLAELYAEALGYDRLTRLCKELGLDLDNPDHVLDLDAALAGLVAEYSLQQKRSEQVAKQAKRHAEELESQRYAILAASRPIHERAEAIRCERRNPTIPGINMDPTKKEPPAAPKGNASEVPPEPPAMPTADQIAASLFELMQQKAREAARRQGEVLEAAPEPAGLLGDGRVSWRALNLWGKQSALKAGSTVKRLLLGFYRDGALAELCDWLFVGPTAADAAGRVTTSDGEEIPMEDAADLDGVPARLPAPDRIDWTGFTEPLLQSIPCGLRGLDQVRSIDSHRVLTAHEISTIDLGFPAEKIRCIEYDDTLQETTYVVTYEEHADHLTKKGRDETVAAEKAEPAKKPKKKGKR